MRLKPGMRLRSQVCATEIIVVRAPAGEVDLTCGGHLMIDLHAPGAGDLRLVPDLSSGSPLGKRFAHPDASLEVLVTKAGAGTLAVGDTPLTQQAAAALPSSD